VICIMDTLFENAHRIFDIARSAAAAGESGLRPAHRDPTVAFISSWKSPFSDGGDRTPLRRAYGLSNHPARANGVRVDGRANGRNCVLEESSGPRSFSREMLRDQPLYRITSPLLTS